MNLKELTIEGYKSIEKITISNANPFTVFVGPNASGKSNIFEAIEFLELLNIFDFHEVPKLFGNPSEIVNQQYIAKNDIYIQFNVDLDGRLRPNLRMNFKDINGSLMAAGGQYAFIRTPNNADFEKNNPQLFEFLKNPSYSHFFNFTRLFVGKKNHLTRNDDSRLNTDASNLEKVLKRILKDENKREEIFETLQLLIPGFEKIEIVSSELSGTDTLIVYETALKKPLTKELISDGTYNILAIIAAIYQSDEPQFLCIEEPENGLNPKVVRELVSIIRNICKEKGHYVWLNTHSQTLVSELTTDEIILVDKVNGLTQIKQIKNMDLHGLRMDEALLTNAIGGGIPW